MNVRKIAELRFLVSMVGAFSPLMFGCSTETCTPYSCASVEPTNGATLQICEGDDDYIRLDDEEGNKVYECFCDVAFMQDVAHRICTEGVVCRPSGSNCSSSGDCCAGLHCTYNVCG